MRKRTSAPKPILRPLLTAAALGTAFLALTTPSVLADAAVYQQHTVNAGVLVVSTDPAPYPFYVLNNRPDVRPPEMNLVNPLAPASALPSQAAYWEVKLNDVSDAELSRYDVLYLRADGITFGPAVNEKLRRFVDGGGQLIVEYGVAASPVPGLFTGAGAVGGSGSVAFPVTMAAQVHQPVISQPYLLSLNDLTNFGTQTLSLAPNSSDTQHYTDFVPLFSSALVDANAKPLVSTAQIGAGQVIISSLNFGAVISGAGVAVFNPPDLYNTANPAKAATETSSLKLLANILSYSEAHPNENKTSHGNASNAGLASFSPAWQFPVYQATSPAPGAAVWGNFVYVTDAAGTLHAFDAYPSENLTGLASTAGAESAISLYPATSYDEIWRSGVGTNASAPMVASFNGTNYVFVEKADGSVVYFNAVTGAAGPAALLPLSSSTTPVIPAPYTSVTYPQPGATNAPSPTFYDGRIYAGQANGSLAVFDLNEGLVPTKGTYFVPLNPSPPTGAVTAEPVTGPPTVGLLPSGDTNVLTAVVPTQYNMYTVLLGGRNEPLKSYSPGAALNGYSINRSGRYDVSNLFADSTLGIVPLLQPYDTNGTVLLGYPASNSTPQDPLFGIPTVGSYFTDWNMNFETARGAPTGTNPVNLNYISASSYGEVNGTAVPASSMSAAAVDRNGNAYYTETLGANSYLVCIGNTPLHSNVHLRFRFRMPTAADSSYWVSYTDANGVSYPPYTDADKTDYSRLIGYMFVGAPVVDDQGNVYAAAMNSTRTNATVLCFRGNQSVAAVQLTAPAVDLTTTTISQPDEGGNTEDNSIFRGPDTNVGAANAVYGQFIGSPSSLTFYNFGKRGSTYTQIAGSLTEPQPVTATDTLGSGAKTQLQMRTNLAWYVSPFPITAKDSTGATVIRPIAGLSQVGPTLFLTNGVNLYRLPTKPSGILNKNVNAVPIGIPLGSGGAGLGAVSAPPSVGGSVMVVSGSAGVAALTRQTTVIADSGRVLGVDGDGGAVWAVDATTRTDDVTKAVTKVAFSHPAALSQFAVNDYLAADTGNNRCVRFDSGGNVRWELTRFNDPSGILGPGQPLTLSQPSSVVLRPTLGTFAANDLKYPNGIATYYLVADSGNNRVLEVADIVVGNNLYSHVLTWASHTGDRDGRSYRYGSAAYYPNSVSLSGYSIAATVVNTRIAPLATAGGPGAVSGDTAGGSIAVFNQSGAPQAFSAGAASDLAFTAAGFYAVDVSGKYVPFTIRNPRFLTLYTPPYVAPPGANPAPAGVAPFDFLYTDDNGVFDLAYDTTRKAFVAAPDRLRFTTADYQKMTLGAVGIGTSFARNNLPFIPVSVQELSIDSQPSATAGGSPITTRRYLITQSHSQGELGNGGKIGGEVFEVDVTNPPPSTGPANFGGYGVADIGGFGGAQTLSHPALVGPLIQPADALRLP